jgi:hypothetical protein
VTMGTSEINLEKWFQEMKKLEKEVEAAWNLLIQSDSKVNEVPWLRFPTLSQLSSRWSRC